MRHSRATPQDLYRRLRGSTWKSGRELVRELEKKGKDTEPLIWTMYAYLCKWEFDKLIESRIRIPTKEYIEWFIETFGQHYALIKEREYQRISPGEPKKLFSFEEIGICRYLF
jgi:hypothetical protein